MSNANITTTNTVALVHKESREILTTSLVVANKFHKRHKNVLMKIESEPDDEFSRLNFKPAKYFDSQGKQRPMYEITRDGFSLLAMGFTGKDARKWKIKFIKAFNQMERHLRQVVKKDWLVRRSEAALEYKTMSRTLEEVRKLAGRDTQPYHYANEAKLVNWAISGEFKKLNRESLSPEELELLTDLEFLNAVLIGAGIDRDTRKERLKSRAESLSDRLALEVAE